MIELNVKTVFACIVGVAAIGFAMPVKSAPRSQVERDVQGYAVAACLTQQKETYLREQGDGWGSVIINRGFGNVEDWQPLIAAVAAEIERTPPMVVHGDGNDKEMPIAYCAEIVDQPDVNEVIGQTIDKMAPAYQGR